MVSVEAGYPCRICTVRKAYVDTPHKRPRSPTCRGPHRTYDIATRSAFWSQASGRKMPQMVWSRSDHCSPALSERPGEVRFAEAGRAEYGSEVWSIGFGKDFELLCEQTAMGSSKECPMSRWERMIETAYRPSPRSQVLICLHHAIFGALS